jgi:hypothetical protein
MERIQPLVRIGQIDSTYYIHKVIMEKKYSMVVRAYHKSTLEMYAIKLFFKDPTDPKGY